MLVTLLEFLCNEQLFISLGNIILALILTEKPGRLTHEGICPGLLSKW